MQIHLTADPEAEELAQALANAEDVHYKILAETLDAADDGRILESGRTACGDETNLIGPQSRFPTAVDLSDCPVGQATGILHSHVTPSELRNPIHSLPDMANVAFGAVDASVVVGAETSHVIAGAADRAKMQQAMREVLGVDVQGPGDVVDAIESGAISNFADHRQELDRKFGALSRRVDSAQPQILDRLEQVQFAPTASSPTDCGCMAAPASSTSTSGAVGRLRDQARNVTAAASDSQMDVEEIVLGTIIGRFTWMVFESTVVDPTARKF